MKNEAGKRSKTKKVYIPDALLLIKKIHPKTFLI